MAVGLGAHCGHGSDGGVGELHGDGAVGGDGGHGAWDVSEDDHDDEERFQVAGDRHYHRMVEVADNDCDLHLSLSPFVPISHVPCPFHAQKDG